MRNLITVLGITALLIVGAKYFLFNNQPEKTMPLTITSPSFEENASIPLRFTCDGENISPELNFANIPAGTQSLALTMEDPDVPKDRKPDGMYNHWVVWNMPSSTTQIKEGYTPLGVTGPNTGGKKAYAGPCPPDREHRYFFTLYALNTMLTIPESSTKEELLQEIAPYIIERALLMGRYNRK